jgi:hypothetical protein
VKDVDRRRTHMHPVSQKHFGRFILYNVPSNPAVVGHVAERMLKRERGGVISNELVASSSPCTLDGLPDALFAEDGALAVAACGTS